MAESAPLYEEFDLKKQRPVAGETRRFATGEAVFLSPLPVSVGHTPMDLGGSFLDVNEVYLDVGQGNINKLFQVQLMIWGVMCILITCLAIAPLVAGMMTFGDPYGRSFFTHAMWILPVSSLFSLILGGAFVLLGLYVVITSTFKKSRLRPLRFNRQRREICYVPEWSDQPIIQPWEEMVSWISVSTGYTGAGVISTYTFGMAIDNPITDKVHFLTHGVFTPVHGLGKWEAIRAYMEKGPEHCPGKAPYEGRHTFDEERSALHQAYREGDASAIGVVWWYLCRVITWWRFPYWVAEWDHRYSLNTMPPSVERWSQPLPKEQWAKPSAELVEQSARLEKAYAKGQSFMDVFKSSLDKGSE